MWVYYCSFVHFKTWISQNMNPFEVLFRAVDQANSGLQDALGVLGTTSRYKEPTVGKVYVE